MSKSYPILSAEEVVSQIKDGDTVAFSGFTPAGSAKVIPKALAVRARQEHKEGHPFKLRILTGASTGHQIDEELALADSIAWRAPYQGEKAVRNLINSGDTEYIDMHLSHVPQMVEFGFLGKIDFAVIEAVEITADGRVFLSTSIGASPTYLHYADKVVIEINRHHSLRLREMADITIMPRPPHRNPIPIFEPLTRIGWPYAVVDPKKIFAIVENNEPDRTHEFSPPDDVSKKIAHHVTGFLLSEMRSGRIPEPFLPLQAGVGNVANGVMAALGADPGIPPFYMYSEVYQDAMVDLMTSGKLLGASACSLSISSAKLKQIVEDIDFFIPKIVLRPQEISNHPGIIRRLGVIALNTILEADIYGNANSSHLYGIDVVNGIGGSGEFTRNSYLSILMAPSIAKGGKISSIVPFCTHIDSNEHSVQVIATEQGLADLRGLGPVQRAKKIISQCAHPAYKDYLYGYLKSARQGHIPHDLARCFELHRNLLEQGSMLPGVTIDPP